MRDVSQTVLYVGKAKNLRKRLGSYRVANPDRMPRRHLRMLRAVARIELEQCTDEQAALARESELLLRLKPRFNRAGTWPAPPRFLAWRQTEGNFELAITETPPSGWEAFGPLGSLANSFRNTLARLIWSTLHPHLGASQMPLGWINGRFTNPTRIYAGTSAQACSAWVQSLCFGEAETSLDWVKESIPKERHRFDDAVITADLEFITDFLLLIATKSKVGKPTAA